MISAIIALGVGIYIGSCFSNVYAIELYKRILKRQVKEREDGLMEFKANVLVHINAPLKSIEDVNVIVPFNVELEFREWGIKSIIVSLSEKMEIEYIDNDEEKSVAVDLSKLMVDEVAGHHITIDDITLWLDKDGMVDYKLSDVDVSLIAP